MRNVFTLINVTSVDFTILQNTFSGQAVRKLWETSAQASRLSPTYRPVQMGMWVTGAVYAQRSSHVSTVIPTENSRNSSLLPAWLSPQSTGPIKNPTKFKKKLGVS